MTEIGMKLCEIDSTFLTDLALLRMEIPCKIVYNVVVK